MGIPIQQNWAQPIRTELPPGLIGMMRELQRKGLLMSEIGHRLNVNYQDVVRALYWNVVAK